ncbi:MAG: TonB-dependent receptor [Leadbetterella sp.]
MNKIYVFFYFLCSSVFAQKPVTISGIIKEKDTQERLMGVNISFGNKNTTTNTFGFFSLTIQPQDSITLKISYVGYNTLVIPIFKKIDQKLEFELTPSNELEEVIITTKLERAKVTQTPLMSKVDIPISQIKKLPTLMGEKDILKALQLMPGVQKASEGQSGLYVRGGGPDQNLIIVDDAVIYNASHLFGFFSTFNGDAVKSVELTKGGFPARYGGRLSSVIDINMKDGNRKGFHGEGGVGLISSRLVLEGPISSKTSFIVSGRRTYQDLLAKPFLNHRNKTESTKVTGGYYFYDLNAKISHDINSKNTLYISTYKGRDDFNINFETPSRLFENSIDWGNNTLTLRWNHIYNQKLFSNTSFIVSDYKFKINGEEGSTDSSLNVDNLKISYFSGIRDFSLKHDLDWYPTAKHTIKSGILITRHKFTPEATVITSDLFNQSGQKKYNALETGIYMEDNWQPNTRIKVNIGIRASIYQADSTFYFFPEPRITASFALAPKWAIKGSFAVMNQYVHLLSNTGLGLPTDLWVPSTSHVKPQRSQQWATGIAHDINTGLIFMVEGYYKTMNNLVNYKEGASFLDLNTLDPDPNSSWEDKVTFGQGYSYGLELLLQKKLGRVSGWIGYTWSKTEWQFDKLNFGESFYPKYDRRHDASIVCVYELNKRITISGTWVYGTGNAMTVPISEYTTQNSNIRRNSGVQEQDAAGWRDFIVNEYSGKNGFRTEPYHRLDVGVQLSKKKRRHTRIWDFSIYNAYNRKNPFFYTVGPENNISIFGNRGSIPSNNTSKIVMKRYSLFPIIPSATYNFKF